MLMVFGRHRNSVPVAWVISSRNSTYDIPKWLPILFDVRMKECPDWHDGHLSQMMLLLRFKH